MVVRIIFMPGYLASSRVAATLLVLQVLHCPNVLHPSAAAAAAMYGDRNYEKGISFMPYRKLSNKARYRHTYGGKKLAY